MKPITEKVLESRVRRALASDGLKLRRCSPRSRWHIQLGQHWLYNPHACRVEQTHVDLLELARDLKVLADLRALVPAGVDPLDVLGAYAFEACDLEAAHLLLEVSNE